MNIVKKLKIKVVNLVPLKIVSYLSQLCSLILKGNSSIEDEDWIFLSPKELEKNLYFLKIPVMLLGNRIITLFHTDKFCTCITC